MRLFWASMSLLFLVLGRSAGIGEIEADLLEGLLAILLDALVLKHTID